MADNKALKSAFIISFIGHGLFLSLPGNMSLPKFDQRPDVPVTLEIIKPALLPKITTLGEEKRLNPPQAPPQQNLKVISPPPEAMLRYQDMVKQKIEEARRYPAWAKKRGIEGVVCLSFTVLPSGLGKNIKITRSANSALLDEEAVATIKRAIPFPPRPEGINTLPAQMEIAIIFSLK